MKRKVLSLLLALVLVISMIPMSALPVSAAKITSLALSFQGQTDIPKVGEPIVYRPAGAITENDDRIKLTGSSIFWRDEQGAAINDSFNDHGCNFEAGRTYYAELTAEALDPASYQFAESTAITLTNPGAFSYTAKVVDIINTQSGHYATIRLTITMNGTRNYPKIAKVVFADSAAPSAVGGLPGTTLYYNNCSVSSQGWYDENSHWTNTAQEGYTYTNKIVLKAKSGYAFDKNVEAVRTYAGAHQTPVSKVLSENDTVLTLTYAYTVDSMTRVGAVELQLAYYYVDTTPITGHPAASQYKMIKAPADAPYEMVAENGTFWWDEKGNKFGDTALFQAGKTYYFEVAFTIKEELEATYRFAKGAMTNTITGEGYTGRGLQKIERVETNTFDDTYVRLRYYYIAQFPAGAGESADNPAVCSDFAAFKYAMEHSTIRHVALQQFQENLPKLEGAAGVAAVSVKNEKHLYLQGYTVLSEAISAGYHGYDSLLQLPAGSSLSVYGPGSLQFRAYGDESKNALIHNMGGTVRVYDGTLIGTFITLAQGVAIWQDAGQLIVEGGSLLGENAMPGTAKNHYAVYINGGSATVKGGSFKAENKGEGQGSCYGLGIGAAANVTLQGGTFRGIHLPTNRTPLSNYVDEDVYTVLSDGSWINPTSQYSQEYTAANREVRVLKYIRQVTALINSPVAGADLENFGLVFRTEGYTLAADYPRWYKDGQRVTSGTFEAGATYEVVLRLMADTAENYEFAPDVTATVNGNTADITTVGTYLKSECISVGYNFGTCPATVPNVELTVTAPKEGNAPSYSVGCGSSAYYAVGGSSNYTEYRQWYMSSDNDDWWEINGNHRFMSGYYYKLYVDIRTNNGYEFPLDSALDPAVSATVNGQAANVIRAYDQDPSRYITVEYNFGECNDTVVEQITVVDVVEPVGGQHPSYTGRTMGTGYRLEPGTYHDRWEGWLYRDNGIVWYDADWNLLNATSTFQTGKQYHAMFRVDIIDTDNDRFACDKYGDTTVTATVNGNKAQVEAETSNPMWNHQVIYTFTCKQPDVLPGDMDGDGDKDTDDAVYLLLNVMFGDGDYPITNPDKDMDNDGKVDTDDAVYLLLHVMFGAEDYPI